MLSGGSAVANRLTGGVDEFFSRSDSSGSVSPLTDALGSTIALTDSTGALQTQYTYEPFGNTTVTGPANPNPFQFTGRENDGTGLYYYRARYYSPIYQRFISEDPAGFSGGVNFYAYAGNNPVSFGDAFGLKPGSGFGGSPPDATPGGAPPPTDPDGKPLPPPVPVPGRPNLGWKWNPDPQDPRGGTWGPKGWKGPNPPRGSWDPDGHWDIDKGDRSPVDHYDPQGNPITPGQAHPGNTPTKFSVPPDTAEAAAKAAAWGAAGATLIRIIIVIGEGAAFAF